jgi:hypothetical protein
MPELLIALEASILVQEVTASVEDRFLCMYLKFFRMVEGVSIDDIDASLPWTLPFSGWFCR